MGDFDIGAHPLILEHRENGASGMTLIGQGDRDVYVHPGHRGVVLKVDTRSDQNQMEVRAWEAAPSSVRAHMARPIAWTRDRELVVQERADREATQAEADRLWRRIDAAGWACNDYRPDNVGVFGGDLKMLDYESCKAERFMRDWKMEKWRAQSPNE